MKCLFLSIDKWKSHVTHLATRGVNIVTDAPRVEDLAFDNCCAVLVTYENTDSILMLDKVTKCIIKEVSDLGRDRILIVPFAHLSSHLGDSHEARNFLDSLVTELKSQGFISIRDHFGSDKALDLVLKSHPGCVRFREY